MEPATKSYLLPESVLAGLLRYLVTRPYGEVAEGIEALKRLDLAPEPETGQVPEPAPE